MFGALNGYLLTGPRVPYALAKQGMLPGSQVFSKLNKGGVPANAIWLVAILASLYALSGRFNLLTDLTVWVFYVFTFIGGIKLRKEKPDLLRPYKVPMYPIIPLIAISGGILITLIGIPVYSYMSKK